MERIRNLAACPVSQCGICATCLYNVVCVGGCRAGAYKAFANLKAPDPACSILPDSAVRRFGACANDGGSVFVSSGFTTDTAAI